MIPGAELSPLSVVDQHRARLRALFGLGARPLHEPEEQMWLGLVEAERRFLCRFAGLDVERAGFAWNLLGHEERARLVKAWGRIEALVDRVRARKDSLGQPAARNAGKYSS